MNKEPDLFETEQEIIEVNVVEVVEKKVEEPIVLMEVNDKTIIIKQGAVISFNKYEALKENITLWIEQFKKKDLSKLSEKELKADRSTLNKASKMLNDLRKSVKKDVMKPYDNLDTQVKELDAIIIDGKQLTDNKLSEIDLKQKEDKKKDIENAFNDYQEEYPSVDFIQLGIMFDDKWLNKGTKLSKITETIEATFIKLNDDIKMIKLDDNGARIKTVYLTNGFNLANAKEVVLGMIAQEQREQAKIDAQMEAKNLVTYDKEVDRIKETTKKEFASEVEDVVVRITKKLSMKFEVIGIKEDLMDILKYMRTKEVQIKKLEEK